MKRFTYSVLLICFISAIVVGCKKLGGPALPADRLKAILLGKDTVTLYAGEKNNVPVTLTPSSYSLDSILWESLDTSVLSISKAGQIFAKKPGATIVSISNIAKTISVNCKVIVKDSLWADLIAYYPFNNNRLDSSGNKNHVVEHKDVISTVNRFGKPNTAYAFNGTSSYMAVADKPALRLNNTDFTINMWVNLDEYIYASGSALLSKNSGPFQKGWNSSIIGYESVNGVPGNPFYNVSGGEDPFGFGNKIITTGAWHMLTITYAVKAAKISFYIDGVFDRTVSNIPSPNGLVSARLHIGDNSLNDIPTNGSPPYYLKGKLDEIRIYKRALKQAEITRLLNLDI